jgi:hypothetical protein
MTRVAGALHAHMATSYTNGVSVVGRNSKSGIIETLLHGLLIGIVDLRIDDFATTQPADFLRIEKAKLDF